MRLKLIFLLLFIIIVNTIDYKGIAHFTQNKLCDYKLLSHKHEIKKNLWLGDAVSALDNDFLIKNNIKLVVNLSKNLDFTDLNIDKYRIPINDNRSLESDLGMIKHFPIIYPLLKKNIDKNNGVLIHCRAGIQRSATLTALYLMKRYNFDIKKAKKFISKKRCIVFLPLTNFDSVLKYFESKLK